MSNLRVIIKQKSRRLGAACSYLDTYVPDMHPAIKDYETPRSSRLAPQIDQDCESCYPDAE